MIECLTNFITLNNTCSPVPPTSGLYLTDHQAISIPRLEQLTGADMATVNDVFTRISGRSQELFESEISRLMSGHMKNRGIVENVFAGRYADDTEAVVSSTDKRGVWIQVDKYSNLALVINTVHLYLTTAGDVDILIYNGNTGVLLDTLTRTGIVGYNVFNINKSYSTRGKNRRFFIAYVAHDSIKTEIGSTWNNSGCDFHCDFDCSNVSVKGASIPTGETVIEDNMDFGSNSFGLLVNFNLVCSVADFICQRLTDFKIAYWNFLAIEFLKECPDNDRINDLTLKMDRTQVNAILWGADNVPGLVSQNNALITDILERSHPANDGICFLCDEPLESGYVIP